MKTVLFINGGKVTQEALAKRFRIRLDWAIEYYREHHLNEEITFLVSGRAGSATETYPFTEAEVGARYILKAIPDATIIKEDISLELIGNYVFAKPLVIAMRPDKVIVITSEAIGERVRYITKQIFADAFNYEFHFMQDELSGMQAFAEKEEQSLYLFKKLFAGVAPGDDATMRDILLYKTPFYFKGIIDDKTFFDAYSERGFEHYVKGIHARNNS